MYFNLKYCNTEVGITYTVLSFLDKGDGSVFLAFLGFRNKFFETFLKDFFD